LVAEGRVTRAPNRTRSTLPKPVRGRGTVSDLVAEQRR
jgi:hypothetical protein